MKKFIRGTFELDQNVFDDKIPLLLLNEGVS